MPGSTSSLIPRPLLVAVVLGLTLLFGLTLPGRLANFDDAWCAEQAYYLWHEGVPRHDMFRGLSGWGDHVWVFHKAFVVAQAGLMGGLGLGFGLHGAQATGLVFALVGLGLLLLYFRHGPAERRWLAAGLYLGCGCLMRFGFVGRPETLALSCGFGSFLLLRPAAGRPLSLGRLLGAGALAGLAALAHLNALIYPAAGVLWLLLPQRVGGGWRAASWFGLAAGLTTSLYFVDAVLAGALPALFEQMRAYPDTANNLKLAAKLQVLRAHWGIFWHSEGEVPLTVLLLLSLGLAHLRPAAVRPRLSPAAHYTGLLALLLWLLTKKEAVYYYLLLLPFLVVFVVEVVTAPAPAWPAWRRRLLLLGLALYPVGSLVRAYNLRREARLYPPTEAQNARLASYMPQRGAEAVVPLDFFFGQATHFRLRSLTYYAYLNALKYGDQLPVAGFFELARRDSATYVVTDHRRLYHGYYVPASAPARVGVYQRVYQDQWHSVYIRQPIPTGHPRPAVRSGPSSHLD